MRVLDRSEVYPGANNETRVRGTRGDIEWRYRAKDAWVWGQTIHNRGQRVANP